MPEHSSTTRRFNFRFAAIPEFQAIGVAVGQQMSSALAGKVSVDDALKASQTAADREMKKGGYFK